MQISLTISRHIGEAIEILDPKQLTSVRLRGPSHSRIIYGTRQVSGRVQVSACGYKVGPQRLEGLLAKFLEHALCHGVVGMAGEPSLQNRTSTIFVSLRHVEPRQVEVGLIEIARRAHGSLEQVLSV